MSTFVKLKPEEIGVFGKDKRCQWSPEMDRILKSDWVRRVSIKQIAHNVGKSEKSVKARRLWLNERNPGCLPPRKQPGVATAARKHRHNIYMTDAEEVKLKRRAMDRQQTIAAYLHYLVRRDLG